MSQHFSHAEEHIDGEMLKVEVNLDDMPGEWLGYVMEKLFDCGANDVFYSSIYMKKNRPAILLQLLCDSERLDEIKRVLFTETTTFGIRYYPISVHRLERTFHRIDTKWGSVTIKRGVHRAEVVENAPEYEDCKEIAEKFGVPIKEVYRVVWEKLRDNE
ncbi:LarC family nickel insertion protein [Guptibacillus algicola]|uniref:LarC family nickel insertion protein n=1 Tax=Guptibacillus algicola TaxID=225844 RepID=UPI0021E5C86A|nr:LarC family nickel insertion protein [Alkalihalobacillus algicola]